MMTCHQSRLLLIVKSGNRYGLVAGISGNFLKITLLLRDLRNNVVSKGFLSLHSELIDLVINTLLYVRHKALHQVVSLILISLKRI